MRAIYVLILGWIAGAFVTGGAYASDWPQWRGPTRDGRAAEQPFNPAFGKGGVDVKWSADLGVGFTGVTVAGGRAFTAGWADGKTTFYAFDAATGEKLWSHSFDSPKYDNLNVGGPSGTAAVDGDRVYHQARDGRTFCYDAAKGTVIWEKDLAQQYGVKVPQWGFSGSPVIIGDTLYLDMGKTLALSKDDGSERWATEDYGPAYSTPAPFTFKGKEYLAVFPSSGLHILDLASGKHIAHQPWKTNYGVHAATPVIVDDTILISSEYDNGCALLRFTGNALEIVWENKNIRQKMGTSVYRDGTFYGFNSTKLVAVDAKTGEEQWNERGLGHGTIILYGDTLIVLSDKGEVLTAPASPKTFKPVTRVSVIKDRTLWTSPTLAGGLLYVRGSEGRLVCIEVSK